MVGAGDEKSSIFACCIDQTPDVWDQLFRAGDVQFASRQHEVHLGIHLPKDELRLAGHGAVPFQNNSRNGKIAQSDVSYSPAREISARIHPGCGRREGRLLESSTRQPEVWAALRIPPNFRHARELPLATATAGRHTGNLAEFSLFKR